MAASESCALLLGCAHSRPCDRGATYSLRLLSIARSQRSPPICCKSRRKSASSQLKRQHAKRKSLGKPPSNSKLSSDGDEITCFQTLSPETFSSSDEVNVTIENLDASISLATNRENLNGTSSLEMEKFLLVSDYNGTDLAPSTHLEDLVGMIRNVERNVLLLNEARIHALEELDKVISEKEDLEGEVNILQMKLAENNLHIPEAVDEKIHFKGVGNNRKKMKKNSSLHTEDDKPNLYVNGSGVTNMEGLYTDKHRYPSLGEGLNSLREENALLKNEIQNLEVKVDEARKVGEKVISLEKERAFLEASRRDLESRLGAYEAELADISSLKSNCNILSEKVENLQSLLDTARKKADQAAEVFSQNNELRMLIKSLEVSLEEAKADKLLLDKIQQDNRLLQDKINNLEGHLQRSEKEISSHSVLYQAAVKEFQETLEHLKVEVKKKSHKAADEEMPWEFWSGLLLMVDGWLLEKKISSTDAKLLREMAWKRDTRICEAYFSCNEKTDDIMLSTFRKLTSSPRSSGMNIIHIAAEMAPVSKVGGLGDVVSGISKALQKRGHLVEVILPKYDCMNCERIHDLKMLDAVISSYFDGQLYRNRIWVGTIEGLPVYFIEPQHPANFFTRGRFYGEHDDFKRFSFFSRAALELLYQAGKRADIIHCHDWHTAFVAPLYWDIYAARGFDSARICFTCHNFEYQGVASASELASCGLDAHHMNRPDRLQDHSSHDRINIVKGAIVFSNIVTTVSPTYAQEVRTPEGGRGLQETLNFHSRKFVGILNGIDSGAWDPSTDIFLRCQYSAGDIQGKLENKVALQKHMKLSSEDASRPMVCCITRLVPQKGVHLIRHAIYRTIELGGQFVLLGSSPVPHIQREFEAIANQFQTHPHIRLILKYDDALSHLIYAASDMLVIPSIFEPCGLTQMIAMRYGSVPIARRTGGLNDSVFDVDDETSPVELRNGFTFLMPDEQGFSNAMERAFKLYTTNPEGCWQQLVRRNMQADFSWDSSSVQYEELYEKAVARARAMTHKT